MLYNRRKQNIRQNLQTSNSKFTSIRQDHKKISESLQKVTGNIMDLCKSELQAQKLSSLNKNEVPHISKRNKSKQILLHTMNSKLSPSEQLQNNKIIQKLRRKYNKKKEVKQIVIRKTDLGENQMIFTKQELQKLKLIDDNQMFGYGSLKTQQNLTLNNEKNTSQQKPQQSKKYFFNPTFDKPKEEIEKYLDWVDLSEIKGSKDKNKNKIINFQKRKNSSTPNLLSEIKKQKFPILNSSPKNISSFAKPKSHKVQKGNKTISLIKKNSVDKGFLNSINSNDGLNNKKLTKQEKMHQIVDKVNEKIEKKLSFSASQKMFIYMTEERKQALFQCEVLRKIKREIGPKYFNNLHITYGMKEKTYQNEDERKQQNKQNNQNDNALRKTGYGQGSKSFSKISNQNGKQRMFVYHKQKQSQMQAQRMIQKNINRLNQERKRVIQKIAC